jgi:hypothetical protein
LSSDIVELEGKNLKHEADLKADQEKFTSLKEKMETRTCLTKGWT